MPHLTKTDQEHIHKIKDQLVAKYGELINRIYCFGSRVESQKQDTDFDVLIITDEKIDWRLEDEISLMINYYGLKNDIFFDVIFYSADEFDGKNSFIPLIENIRSKGVII